MARIALLGLALLVVAVLCAATALRAGRNSAALHGLEQFESEELSFSFGDDDVQKRDVKKQNCSPDGTVCMQLVRDGDTVTGKAIVSSFIETSLQVKFTKRVNIKITDAKGKIVKKGLLRTVLGRRMPGTEKNEFVVFRVVRADKSKKWSFDQRFFYHVGSYKAQHSKTATYRLPFKGSFRVGQGYKGKFSHKGAQAFSIDFQMPEGTPVLAPRAGVIASVVSDQSKSKFDAGVCKKPVTFQCKTPGSEDNHVLIRYDDGTYGYLAHLKQNGVTVKPGDQVTAGQLIGYSGNTGFSKGPHLHVMVNRALPYTDKRRWFFESIRVAYTDASGKSIIPAKGETYEGA